MAERVFLRGISGEKYDLRAKRYERLAASHVVHPEDRSWRDEKAPGHEDASPQSRARWLLGPGDEPFLTQTVQVHHVRIDPGGSNGGHAHENEAMFYILEGEGYEIHDGQRYDWKAGDLVVVHTDCRHQHFNKSQTEHALALVLKPKALFMYLGLTQQGKRSTVPEGHEDEFGDREEWGQLWTPGLDARRKIVPSEGEPWVVTRDGRVKWLARQGMDSRVNGLDIWLQELPAGGRSAKHWHIADEVFYVISGSGRTLEWDVEADIDDRYYARVKKEPKENRWSAGDLVYVPTNTVHQHFAEGGPALLIGAQNRAFKLVGYDSVVYREEAPEWSPELAGAAAD